MAPPYKKRTHEPEDSASSEDDDPSIQKINSDHWSRFLVMSSTDGSALKLNPFAIAKGIEGLAGEVKEVKMLRAGCLLIECKKHIQSQILLSTKSLANVPVQVSPHRTLNSSKGIVRDVIRCLSDMTKAEIVAELKSQNVTDVKRFTMKRDNETIKTNTYLFTFGLPARPESLKAGYCNLRVDAFIPNPLRCYSCQKFGHGSKSCRNAAACHRCGGACEDGKSCTNPPSCVNCSGSHPSSSKECPTWKFQSKISRIKHDRNVSFLEARKSVLAQEQPGSSYATTASVRLSKPKTKHVSLQTITCQTDYTWTKTSAPTLVSTAVQVRPPRQSSCSQTIPSSQTIIQSQAFCDKDSSLPQVQSLSQSTQLPKSDTNVKQLANTKSKSKAEPTKKNLSGRSPKGSSNQVQLFNKFGSLEDMDVSESSHFRSHSLSPSRKVRGRSPVNPPKR
ncbi:uncharacterized protein LOC124268557 [Haliotis rubra]|uniref:uncharacterized protein LOC124268557 n=1 Tax=Haliotis rubra TaxID=36100 RepID=UPI001EE5007A|nr:uncharacterized protein LOC124268557 [Haliotis rubra]